MLESKVDDLTNKYEDANAKLLNNETTCLEKTFKESVDYKIEAERIKKSAIWSLVKIIGAVLGSIGIASFLLYLKWSHDKEVILQ